MNKGNKREGRGCYAPALVHYVALAVRNGRPPHAMPRPGGGALPPLLTKALRGPMLTCCGGLTNADQNAYRELADKEAIADGLNPSTTSNTGLFVNDSFVLMLYLPF